MAKKPENGKEFDRRHSAYHEAGHASMFWFFQQDLIREVRLYEVGGIVYARRTVRQLEIRNAHGSAWAQANARMLVMHCFAGPCADYLFDEELSGGDPNFWFESLCQDYTLNGDDYAQPQSSIDEDDMEGAIGVAQELNPKWKSPGVFKFLSECADWTCDAVTSVPMRETIDALAMKLLKSKTGTINGLKAWDIMSYAWGDRALPLHQRKWKARFSALEK